MIMCFFTALFAATAVITPAFSSTTPLRAVERYDGKTTGKFIIKLKDGASKSTVLQQLKANAVTHEWNLFDGFAADLEANDINLLRSSPDVELISEDGIMHVMAIVNQTNAPWGLARLSSPVRLPNQDPNSLTNSYIYDSSAGAGVDIYIIGKYRFWITYKKANIIAVKVLSNAGSGSVADIISGINFVITSARASGRPSVACMTLGGAASTSLDSAVASLTSAGVHIAVAAGNSNVDAVTSSPARAPSAITVRATTIADAHAAFSNFGSVVDIFAPGQNVVGPWVGGSTVTNTLSGTSPATCYVAGLIAYIIGLNGNTTPAEMSNLVKSWSLKGALSGIPSGTLNDLAHNTP